MMVEFWCGIAYGLIALWVFTGTYRSARRANPQGKAWREALECGIGSLFWPLVLPLVALVVFILWLGFRGDRT